MKKTDRRQLLFLIFIWSLFLLWEYQIQGLSITDKDELVRYDLMVLPVLVVVSAYTLYSLLSADRKSSGT